MQSYVLLTYSATIFLYFYELFRLSLAACGICRLFLWPPISFSPYFSAKISGNRPNYQMA